MFLYIINCQSIENINDQWAKIMNYYSNTDIKNNNQQQLNKSTTFMYINTNDHDYDYEDIYPIYTNIYNIMSWRDDWWLNWVLYIWRKTNVMVVGVWMDRLVILYTYI